MLSVNKRQAGCHVRKADRLFSQATQLVKPFFSPQDFLSATLQCHLFLMRVAKSSCETRDEGKGYCDVRRA